MGESPLQGSYEKIGPKGLTAYLERVKNAGATTVFPQNSANRRDVAGYGEDGWFGKCVHSRSATLPHYRGTSLIRNTPPVGPYSSLMPRALRWSWGGRQFLVSEVPLYQPYREGSCETPQSLPTLSLLQP